MWNCVLELTAPKVKGDKGWELVDNMSPVDYGAKVHSTEIKVL
jgi:hypothetical protein